MTEEKRANGSRLHRFVRSTRRCARIWLCGLRTSARTGRASAMIRKRSCGRGATSGTRKRAGGLMRSKAKRLAEWRCVLFNGTIGGIQPWRFTEVVEGGILKLRLNSE